MDTTMDFATNILEEELVTSFQIINWMQLVIGSCRIHLRGRKVRVPTIYQKLYTVVASLTISIIVAISFFYRYINKCNDSPITKWLRSAFIVTSLTSYLLNSIHVRFVNNKANMNFTVQVQELDRIMGIQNNVFMYSTLKRLNKLVALSVILMFIAIISFAIMDGVMTTLLFTGLTIFISGLSLEIGVCANLALHFATRVQFINGIISNYLKPNLVKAEPSYRLTLKNSEIRWIASLAHEFATVDTRLYLNKIFTCFNKYQDLFRFQIFIFFCQYLSFTIIFFEFGLEVLRKKTFAIHEWILIATLLIQGFIIMLSLCLRCESFYKEVAKTKRLSVAVMAKHSYGPLRSKAKGMARLVAEAASRFSVYGMWLLDARVVLRVFAATTTVLITILQFAVL